jgi:hypothetical protein
MRYFFVRSVVCFLITSCFGEAFASGSTPDGSSKSNVRFCREKVTYTPEAEIRKTAIAILKKREPEVQYEEIDLSKTSNNCGWLVIATRNPKEPGGHRILTMNRHGKLLAYRAGL